MRRTPIRAEEQSGGRSRREEDASTEGIRKLGKDDVEDKC